MNEFLKVIRQHREKYPLMQMQDMVKLIYQGEFGPGHFVENPKLSLQRLKEEYRKVNEPEGQTVPCEGRMEKRTETIGNGFCRYYLQGLEERELEVLNRIFVYSANNRQGSKEVFEQKLNDLQVLLKETELGFSEAEYGEYIRAQKAKGYPPVSHSERYRNAYRPAYRVIEERYAPYLDLIAKVEKMKQKKERLVIGIDGNAAAGKTTLAQCLMELYDCEVIHMDEFFLPGEMRTPMRMEEAGGNVHYERFAAEVVEGIRRGKPFEYRVFSCSDMNYTGVKRISNRKMLVIEGSYSMRKEFQDVYDCKIFLKLSEELQKQRIIERNGRQMYEMFRDKWIPMENRYFEAFRAEAVCDYIYSW